MPAATLNCPSCGASLSPDSTSCPYCNTRLATISCPSCFGLAFAGSKFCPHCGQALASPTTVAATHLLCPICRIPLEDLNLAHIQLHDCEQCCGIWVDTATFQKICADREEQAAILGSPTPVTHEENLRSRAYIPCPKCGQIMTPTQFSRRSGVIIDICRAHGVWFDREELRRIIEFIRAGGLDRAREMEKDELDRERREIDAKRGVMSPEEHLAAIACSRGLLDFLLRI
jgi:Zn-finger nucleic acid-binding protein